MAEAMMPDEDGYEDYEDDDLTYPMLSSPKGICLIINNRDFANSGPNSAKWETRSGTDADRGYTALESDALATERELIPNESDFLIAHSTVPGFESYRDTQKGSVYIQTLARTLSKHSGLEIHDVLTKVNYAVGHKTNKVYGENSGYKQSPAPLYTLRKKLILGQVVQGVNPLNNLLTQRRGTGTSSSVVSDEGDRSTEPRQSPPEKTGQEGIIHDLLQKAEGMKPHFEWLTHAYKCQNSSGCKQPRCREMKHVMEHMKTCTRGQSCKALHCAAVSPFLVHVSSCMQAGCSVCRRFKE
ncbi:uncharacterized protein [Littorina saxatilis]|uniref:uncharacterized protein isoform X2 n=1 Tax=Littorina saxatilis TaxID=31220 RepID=UPI0038B4E64E